jgi:hypothetical protein
MQTYNYISANYRLFLTIRIVTSLEICSFHTIVVQDLFFFGDVTLHCLNDTFWPLRPLMWRHYYLNLRITLTQRQIVTCPNLLRLSTIQTQKTHAIYKTAWTPLMLLQHSPLLTVVYRCNISIAVSSLTREMVANIWWWTSYPSKESVNVLDNAQPEETCFKQPVSYNMEPQLH